MDKKQFLRNVRASKVPVHPLQIDGWDGLIYLRPATLGEIRDTLLEQAAQEGEHNGTPVPSATSDPLFIARNIARLVRDEAGELLFDSKSEADMQSLMEVLADAAPSISKRITEAYNKLNEPTLSQETPEGNSPSARNS